MSDPLWAVDDGHTPLDDDTKRGRGSSRPGSPRGPTSTAPNRGTSSRRRRTAANRQLKRCSPTAICETCTRPCSATSGPGPAPIASPTRSSAANGPRIAGNVFSLVRDVAYWVDVVHVPARRDRCAVSSPACRRPPVPQRQRPPQPTGCALPWPARWAHNVPPGVRAWACRLRTCARLYIAALVQADRTDDVSALVTFALS